MTLCIRKPKEAKRHYRRALPDQFGNITRPGQTLKDGYYWQCNGYSGDGCGKYAGGLPEGERTSNEIGGRR